jgi:hypothetical protein
LGDTTVSLLPIGGVLIQYTVLGREGDTVTLYAPHCDALPFSRTDSTAILAAG